MHDIIHYIAHDTVTIAALDLDPWLYLTVVSPYEKFLGKNSADLKHWNLILTLFVIYSKQKLSFDFWQSIIAENAQSIAESFKINIAIVIVLLCEKENYSI